MMPACKAHSRTCDALMPDLSRPGASIRDVVFWRDMWRTAADGQACACMLLAALKLGVMCRINNRPSAPKHATPWELILNVLRLQASTNADSWHSLALQ